MAIPFSTPEESDPDQFLNRAKQIVTEEICGYHPWLGAQDLDHLRELEVYIVWFSKTLQNWKACVSTSIPDGQYYEVTYNGDKQEAYIDTYEKVSNRAVKDAN